MQATVTPRKPTAKTTAGYSRAAPLRNLAGMRQWVEAIFDTLQDQLALERHGGRTPAGAYARIAQRLLALAACIWHNWRISAPDKRSLIAYDH